MVPRLSSPRLLPLTIVVMLLLLTAKAVTFAEGAESAPGPSVTASATAQPAPGKAMPDVIAASLPRTSPAAISDPNERALLEDLRKRREALDAREHALDERSSLLEAATLRLQSKIDKLSELQRQLDALGTARKQRQDASWNGLVKVYEDMKPREAAAIFDVLDMHVLLQVLDRMNERKAAAVLAAMQPERARFATQMLVQMRLGQDNLVVPLPANAQQSPRIAQ